MSWACNATHQHDRLGMGLYFCRPCWKFLTAEGHMLTWYNHPMSMHFVFHGHMLSLLGQHISKYGGAWVLMHVGALFACIF